MAKVHSISPWQMEDRPGWYATFREVQNRRVTRGLGTRDKHEADLLCRSLAVLVDRRPERLEDAPAGVPPKALELYFGADAVKAAPTGLLVAALPTEPMNESDLASLPVEARIRMEAIERRNQQLEYEARREELRLEALERELAGLKDSVLARAATAAANCPPMSDALESFKAHMRATAGKNHAEEMIRVATAFTKAIDARTTAQVSAEQVGRWLDLEAAKSDSPFMRRARHRVRLSRFLTWASRTYEHLNPMTLVPAPKSKQLERERDDVHWHELAEIEATVKALPDAYWKALVGTLVYAGLRLSELVFLRRVDLKEEEGARFLWVTTVDDGHGDRHATKSAHSRRAIQVSADRLWPLLETHMKDDVDANNVFLFPMPKGMRRRKRSSGHPERWRTQTLSRRLSGMLPDTMNALSLRRTFGSLLLRAKKSVNDVAAAMGNTPDVVQKHYARILGAEVKVDF